MASLYLVTDNSSLKTCWEKHKSMFSKKANHPKKLNSVL